MVAYFVRYIQQLIEIYIHPIAEMLSCATWQLGHWSHPLLLVVISINVIKPKILNE